MDEDSGMRNTDSDTTRVMAHFLDLGQLSGFSGSFSEKVISVGWDSKSALLDVKSTLGLETVWLMVLA